MIPGIVCVTGIGGAMAALAVMLLIILFIGKMINVMRIGSFYDPVHIFTSFVLGVLAFFFVMVGALSEQTVLFSTYLNFSSLFLVAFVFLTILEVLLIFVLSNDHAHMQTSFSQFRKK